MLLIGMFDSPFVRRVAITMKMLNIPFEHGNWSVGKDFEQIRKYNPLGRVPALVLDDGEVVIESSAILDHLDQLAGDHALLPHSGADRRHALHIMVTATGSAEKGVSIVYESAFRPLEKRHQPWVDRCRAQVHGGLQQLEKICEARNGQWLIGHSIMQPDITVACVATFLKDTMRLDPISAPYPALWAHVQRCEVLPEFKATYVPFFVPNS
jgi:glutathione S-transferase